MIERYLVVVGRIRQELTELERVVARAKRAVAAARQRSEDQDLYLDSAALSLHDFYAGLERVFRHIAATMDGSVPAGREWHEIYYASWVWRCLRCVRKCCQQRPSKLWRNTWAFGMWCAMSTLSSLTKNALMRKNNHDIVNILLVSEEKWHFWPESQRNCSPCREHWPG